MKRANGRRAQWAGSLFALSTVALLGSCLRSTEATPSELQLAGDWVYTGVQTGPVRESVAGELHILGQSGTSFHGQLNVLVTNEANGQLRTLDGMVSGSADEGVVDFDAHLETTARRHVGRLVANTITGTWVSSSPGGTMSSGTFRAERETQ